MKTMEYIVGEGLKTMTIFFHANRRADADRDMKDYAGNKKLEFVAEHPADHLQKMGDGIKMPETPTKYRHDADCNEKWASGSRCRHSQPIL